MQTLVDRFCKVVCHCQNSKPEHYISAVAHCGSLSCHSTATERSENVTLLCSTARAYITTTNGSN